MGFAIYNWQDNFTEHRVYITMNETRANVTIASNDPIITKDTSTNSFEVILKMPVRILPNVEYMGQFRIAVSFRIWSFLMFKVFSFSLQH